MLPVLGNYSRVVDLAWVYGKVLRNVALDFVDSIEKLATVDVAVKDEGENAKCEERDEAGTEFALLVGRWSGLLASACFDLIDVIRLHLE